MPRLFCLSIPQTSIKVNIVMRNITRDGFSRDLFDFASRRGRHGLLHARRQIAVFRTLSLSAIWTRNAEVGTKTTLNFLCLTVDIVSP